MDVGKRPFFDILFVLLVWSGLLIVAHAMTPKPVSSHPRHVSWACRDAVDSALETKATQPALRPVFISFFSLATVSGREPLTQFVNRAGRSVATSQLLIALGPRRVMHASGDEPVALGWLAPL